VLHTVDEWHLVLNESFDVGELVVGFVYLSLGFLLFGNEIGVVPGE
jgi:hypothetical protein